MSKEGSSGGAIASVTVVAVGSAELVLGSGVLSGPLFSGCKLIWKPVCSHMGGEGSTVLVSVRSAKDGLWSGVIRGPSSLTGFTLT